MLINTNDKDILLAYKGPFYIDILSNLGTYIRQMFVDYPLTSIRMYKLFFELTQNVAKYSALSTGLLSYRYSGIGSFTIKDDGCKVELITSNLIHIGDGDVLLKYCNEINGMDKESLRSFKRQKRRIHPEAHDTGAHIGIIQIGILTQNHLLFNVLPYDDKFSIFTISACINKDIN